MTLKLNSDSSSETRNLETRTIEKKGIKLLNSFIVEAKQLRTYREMLRTLKGLLNLEMDRTVTVSEFAKEFNLNYQTVKRNLLMAEVCKLLFPEIALDTEEFKISVKRKPPITYVIDLLIEGVMHKVLTKMYLEKTFDAPSAIFLEHLAKEEKEVLSDLLAAGYIIQTPEGSFYLSKKGITVGASGVNTLFKYGYNPLETEV